MSSAALAAEDPVVEESDRYVIVNLFNPKYPYNNYKQFCQTQVFA